MFPDPYFTPRFFAPRYWPGGVGGATTTAEITLPLRLAVHDSLEATMTYVDRATIGLAYDDAIMIDLQYLDMIAAKSAFDTRENLDLTANDVIVVWMNEY